MHNHPWREPGPGDQYPPRPISSRKLSSSQIDLIARADALARREGLIATDSGKARIYRDPVGGTVMWLPHGQGRLELTLIQVRMVAEDQASRLHGLLARSVGKTTEQIPPHYLGLDAAEAVSYWAALQQNFFPPYLEAHRQVQADRGPRR